MPTTSSASIVYRVENGVTADALFVKAMPAIDPSSIAATPAAVTARPALMKRCTFICHLLVRSPWTAGSSGCAGGPRVQDHVTSP